MQSLCRDVTLVLDAETVRVYTKTDWCGQGAEAPCEIFLHGGQVAETVSHALAMQKPARLSFFNRVHVIVGNPWVHLIVLPWQAGLFSNAAWQAYARALFAQSRPHGNWRFCVQSEKHGRTRLSAVLCEDVLGAIEQGCQSAGWRLVSVRDEFSSLLRRHAALASAPGACFILAQRHVVSCLFRGASDWRDLVMLARTRNDLGEWLLGASLLADLAVPTSVHVAGLDLPELPAGFERLEGWTSQAVECGDRA